MKQKGSTRRIKREIHNKKPQQTTIKYLLESGNLANMQAAKNKTQDLLIYHWNFYSELARQRSVIENEGCE